MSTLSPVETLFRGRLRGTCSRVASVFFESTIIPRPELYTSLNSIAAAVFIMFDGNYRTTRRPVSLSGRRRKADATTTTTVSRATILETSRRQREERSLRDKQMQASIRVQKQIRRYLTQRQLAKQLEEQLSDNTSSSLATIIQCLNVRLALSITTPPSNSTLQSWLQLLEAGILSEREQASLEATSSSSVPLAHRIVRTILRMVRMGAIHPTTIASNILEYCVVLPCRHNHPLPSSNYYLIRLGWHSGYRELLETMQSLAATTAKATKDTDDDNTSLYSFVRLLWDLIAAATPNTHNGAMMCMLVLIQSRVFQQSSLGTTLPFIGKPWLTVDGGMAYDALYQQGLVPFVNMLMETDNSITNETSWVLFAMQTVYKKQQTTILINAMELYDKLVGGSGSGVSLSPDSSPLIVLINQVMQQSPQLALLSGMVARGDNIRKLFESIAATGSVDKMVEDTNHDDDSDSDGGSDDYEAAPTARTQTTRSTTRPTGARLTKNDLQTMTKINTAYSRTVDLWQAEVVGQLQSKRNDMERLLPLAEKLGQAQVWLDWGRNVLSPANDRNNVDTQLAYVTLLAVLLQTSTGLLPRQSVANSLLTKLAFHQEFLENLFRFTQSHVYHNAPLSMKYTALSVFCDIFSHRLIAMTDDQFLFLHTNMVGDRVIMAETVITQLRDWLYEMYWSRPVRAQDVIVPFRFDVSTDATCEALRGRLFLTGTKLWNTLYERWCRLVRNTPFCSESCWLFPPMITLTSESAVSGASSRRNHVLDVSAMEVDDVSDSDDEDMFDQPMSTADQENDALADVFSDPKMARILTCIPHALPFDKRVRLFDSLLRADKAKTQDENAEMHAVMLGMMRGEEGEYSTRERVSIRRENIYEDSMRQLSSLGPKLRKKVQVTFTNQHGALEAGIDGGGVFKEFIDDLISDAFVAQESSYNLRLFEVTPLETLAVNPRLSYDFEMLPHYEFLGRVLGKAVYESILVEPQFCLPFLNQLLGKPNSLEDLKNYDPEIYSNLTKLLNAPAEDINSMGLSFEMTTWTGDSTQTVELMPGGNAIAVTKQNAVKYVHLIANQRLNVETAQATKAFLRGFRDLIPASWVRLFSAYELQKLISGDDAVKSIDVSSLKASMHYAAGYHPSQPVIQWFWEIIEELDVGQQRKFLKFMTSCSRQPLLGFSSMAPAPCVQQIRIPDHLRDLDNSSPLPTSSTCMNLLKLPNYRSKELMKKKLLAAIESGAGFELT